MTKALRARHLRSEMPNSLATELATSSSTLVVDKIWYSKSRLPACERESRCSFLMEFLTKVVPKANSDPMFAVPGGYLRYLEQLRFSKPVLQLNTVAYYNAMCWENPKFNFHQIKKHAASAFEAIVSEAVRQTRITILVSMPAQYSSHIEGGTHNSSNKQSKDEPLITDSLELLLNMAAPQLSSSLSSIDQNSPKTIFDTFPELRICTDQLEASEAD
ncbi:uncharacterized protein PHALS_07747 [Plasmopara halstedii]|uniref:Uncharacterized protein n=1 Tax=Plasmopara halstedii TaxID=4781 RepID=A0A0P1B6W5_PLAHL|nr:uncharacterized protein PHALS_07747 [Plasmopara halstedii]CEG50017.1 hypothetical protein PHALS_07747 [Plasmopara halstedii]|eukprot:XP_024586386.1 hypothetical protein PHALS_07747 [Plasmopara halstedii]